MLPKSFKFSPKITVISCLLATVMIWCSTWQWERYKAKVALVETYQEHSDAAPLALPKNGDFTEVTDRRIRLSGSYDYQHEVIVLNQKHESGPGYWLLTPLKLKGREEAIIVSRGFIPFADREPNTWGKYQFVPQETLDAVVKKSVSPRMAGPQNPEVGENIPFQTKWFFPEINRIAAQLPYPVIQEVFVQRIGGPQTGEFPAESIRIEVPPQTHFGYTIEWALLAFASLLVGFLLQAYPRRRSKERVPAEMGASNGSLISKQ